MKPKSLGQIAFEADGGTSKEYDDLVAYLKDDYVKMARAVAKEARKRLLEKIASQSCSPVYTRKRRYI